MPWGPHNRPLPQPGRYQRPRHRGGSAATAPRRPLVPWIPQGTAPGSQRPAARIQLGVTCFIKQQLKRVQRPGEGARLPPHAGSSGRCRQDADMELGSPRRQQPPPLGIRGAGESREEPPAGSCSWDLSARDVPKGPAAGRTPQPEGAPRPPNYLHSVQAPSSDGAAGKSFQWFLERRDERLRSLSSTQPGRTGSISPCWPPRGRGEVEESAGWGGEDVFYK